MNTLTYESINKLGTLSLCLVVP